MIERYPAQVTDRADKAGAFTLVAGAIHATLADREEESSDFRASEIEDLAEVIAGAGEVGAGEVGVDEVGAGEVGAGETGAGEVGAGEVGVDEVGAGEVGVDETGAGEVGAGEVGVDEVGADEVGADEVGAGEVGAGETGAGETGIGEVGAGEQSGHNRIPHRGFAVVSNVDDSTGRSSPAMRNGDLHGLSILWTSLSRTQANSCTITMHHDRRRSDRMYIDISILVSRRTTWRSVTDGRRSKSPTRNRSFAMRGSYLFRLSCTASRRHGTSFSRRAARSDRVASDAPRSA